jgi:uncharacterized cupredoxin-like copper-binding protein
MAKCVRFIPATLAVFLLLAGVPVKAAETSAVQTIKVALLDMSSIAGPGMGPGSRQGLGRGFGRGPGNREGMGPGGGQGRGPGNWQGRGRGEGFGPGNGQGMMGPGWGWGGGQGAGWMAQHMMGPGMMGMGMMSIRTSKATAKAGKVRFDVVNYSASLVHEMEVVAVDDLNAPLPYDYNLATVKIDKAKERGEVENLGPSEEKVLELTLPAGNYLLVCNIPGHYAAGMVAPFTVTP